MLVRVLQLVQSVLGFIIPEREPWEVALPTMCNARFYLLKGTGTKLQKLPMMTLGGDYQHERATRQ